jgi:hypothetical protein
MHSASIPFVDGGQVLIETLRRIETEKSMTEK